jgi:hypothetical protein
MSTVIAGADVPAPSRSTKTKQANGEVVASGEGYITAGLIRLTS